MSFDSVVGLLGLLVGIILPVLKPAFWKNNPNKYILLLLIVFLIHNFSVFFLVDQSSSTNPSLETISMLIPVILLVIYCISIWINPAHFGLIQSTRGVQLTEYLFKTLEAQGVKSALTFQALAKTFGKNTETVLLGSDEIVKALSNKINEWIKVSERKDNRDDLDYLTGYALITIANISKVHGIEDGKKVIRGYHKEIIEKKNKAYSRGPKIIGSIQDAMRIISPENSKPDYDCYI